MENVMTGLVVMVIGMAVVYAFLAIMLWVMNLSAKAIQILNKYLEFLNTIKNRSMKDYNVLVLETDKIITLSTCSLDNTKRIVVHGKLLSIN